MDDREEYIEKIYEEFSGDIEPTEELKKIYSKFSKKIVELKEELNEKQLKQLNVVEDLFSEIIILEVKQGFSKGFSVASNIDLETSK